MSETGLSETAKPQVTFAVAGAQKAGTRALKHYLSQHPRIGLSRPDIPETHFFDQHADDAEAGRYAVYHDKFTPEALARPAVGDVTPIYIFAPEVLPRLRAYNPDMKIIVLLRDPVARAYSQWAMETQRNDESRGFAAALLHELYWVCRYGRRRRHRVYSYVQRGFYSRQLTRLFRYFPPEQCLILRNDALRTDHGETLARIHRFLGVPPQPVPAPETVHSRSYRPMSRAMVLLLRLIFYRDVRRLEKMLGWDCRDWRFG